MGAIDCLHGRGKHRPEGRVVRVVSFGYKHGSPPEGAEIFDCRMMRNPFFEPLLKNMNGRDLLVQNYVADDVQYHRLLNRAAKSAQQGNDVAFGCMGGKHRSVAMAEALKRCLEAVGVSVQVEHRCL